MAYLSDLIDDLAFLFPYIDEMEAKYKIHNMSMKHKIIVVENGFILLITPYVLSGNK